MSLIDVVRTRFLEAIAAVAPGQWKVLVVDEHAKRLLGANLKENDVLSERVTTIDLITSYRAPEPNMEAMYLVMPTTQNVDRIIKDFTDKQMYSGAWLHFTDRLTEKLLHRLGQSPANPFLQKVSDLYINFWAIESQAFSLYSPTHFFSMFSPPRTPSLQRSARDRLEEDLRFCARSIGNVCIQMNENPTIRYYLPSHHPAVGPLSVPHRPGHTQDNSAGSGGSRWKGALGVGSRVEYSNEDHLCRILAFMVQEELDMYKRMNPTWPEPSREGAGLAAHRPPSSLIITDRTMDMMAPFVHEFTYQAMANDLLPIANGSKFRYEYENSSGVKQTMTATLSESDSLWVQTRHLHIKETIDKVISDLKEFQEQNGVFMKAGTTSIDDVKDMLAGLPQFQEGQQQFSLHYNMAKQCMDLFVNEARKLASMANVEQNCATGVNPEGKTPKTLVEEMIPLLADTSVKSMDKVRVIALYIMYRDGVPDEDRRRLFEHSQLSRQERAAVDNLVSLGVRVTRAAGDKDTRRRLKNRFPDSDYDLSRFRPMLTTVLEDLVAGKLDPTVFPFAKDPMKSGPSSPTTAAPPAPAATSLRHKAVWAKPGARPAGGAAGRGHDNRQRIFVFVAGGMTYSEMRSAYELSNRLGKDIYIGSTHTITPEEFLGDLQTLDIGGQGSASIPGGLPESSSAQQRPFQVYYDQKYMTKDEPPPPPKPSPLPPPPPASNSSGLLGLPISIGRSASPSPAVSESEKKGEEKKKKRFLGF